MYFYENFKSIYAFEEAINKRPVNEIFNNYNTSSILGTESFTETKSFEEAENLLRKGWNKEVKKMEAELKNFSGSVKSGYNKQIKNIAGYAPCVPNAIKGVPKSMYATKTAKKDFKAIHIIINNTAAGCCSSKDLMESGMLFLKLATLLEKNKIRTKIDIIPKMSKTGDNIYGCTINLKDYRQPFNISKIAYPLAHTSMFRRHGFKWWETLPINMPSEATNYGYSMIYISKYKKKEYFQYAGFLDDNVIYLDFEDAQKAGFNIENLIKNKGINL